MHLSWINIIWLCLFFFIFIPNVVKSWKENYKTEKNHWGLYGTYSQTLCAIFAFILIWIRLFNNDLVIEFFEFLFTIPFN